MDFKNLTYEQKIDLLINNYRQMQDTMAGLQQFKKCAERLYSDMDGFEGDIPEIKEHLKHINGTVRQHDMDIGINRKDIGTCKLEIAKLCGDVSVLRLEIKFKQALILLGIAVGGGGGSVIIREVIKAVFGI